jgi:hypothetical protein
MEKMKKLSKAEISITKTVYGLKAETFYNGYYWHHLYVGMNKTEAIKRFIKFIENETKNEFVNIPI